MVPLSELCEMQAKRKHLVEITHQMLCFNLWKHYGWILNCWDIWAWKQPHQPNTISFLWPLVIFQPGHLGSCSHALWRKMPWYSLGWRTSKVNSNLFYALEPWELSALWAFISPIKSTKSDLLKLNPPGILYAWRSWDWSFDFRWWVFHQWIFYLFSKFMFMNF